jgi:hypothetical protein
MNHWRKECEILHRDRLEVYVQSHTNLAFVWRILGYEGLNPVGFYTD